MDDECLEKTDSAFHPTINVAFHIILSTSGRESLAIIQNQLCDLRHSGYAKGTSLVSARSLSYQQRIWFEKETCAWDWYIQNTRLAQSVQSSRCTTLLVYRIWIIGKTAIWQKATLSFIAVARWSSWYMLLFSFSPLIIESSISISMLLNLQNVKISTQRTIT